MDPVIIVGTGLAGYTLAREFRRLDSQTPLLLVSADDGASYAKPMLSSALSQGKDARTLIQADATTMATRLPAEILANTPVSTLDPHRREIVLANGRRLRFRDLVLAVGARPIRPDFAGVTTENTLSVNNLTDYARFRALLTPTRSVAIIGSGLIGCEFACDILASGREVSVIGRGALPLTGLLPDTVAEQLRDALTAAGVSWHLADEPAEIEADPAGGHRLKLKSGMTLRADLVLSAIGLRPDTRLAAAAGLAVGRGIKTDASLATSGAHIHALGDCAEIDGRVLPYVAPIMVAARALAQTLTGTHTSVRWPPMPVVVKTPVCPLVILPPTGQGTWQFSASADGLEGLFLDPAGHLTGFALAGSACAGRPALIRRMETEAAHSFQAP